MMDPASSTRDPRWAGNYPGGTIPSGTRCLAAADAGRRAGRRRAAPPRTGRPVRIDARRSSSSATGTRSSPSTRRGPSSASCPTRGCSSPPTAATRPARRPALFNEAVAGFYPIHRGGRGQAGRGLAEGVGSAGGQLLGQGGPQHERIDAAVGALDADDGIDETAGQGAGRGGLRRGSAGGGELARGVVRRLGEAGGGEVRPRPRLDEIAPGTAEVSVITAIVRSDV